MAKIKVTEENIKELEYIADLSYATLRIAVETKSSGALKCAKILYKGMGDYLSELTEPTRRPELLNKGGKRAKEIERFILQWLLMCNSIIENDGYKTIITENSNEGLDGLKDYIDSNDEGDSAKGEIFGLIANKAEKLRSAGQYNLILKLLGYVREKYPSSDISVPALIMPRI